jgi:hypothetical protein
MPQRVDHRLEGRTGQHRCPGFARYPRRVIFQRFVDGLEDLLRGAPRIARQIGDLDVAHEPDVRAVDVVGQDPQGPVSAALQRGLQLPAAPLAVPVALAQQRHEQLAVLKLLLDLGRPLAAGLDRIGVFVLEPLDAVEAERVGQPSREVIDLAVIADEHPGRRAADGVEVDLPFLGPGELGRLFVQFLERLRQLIEQVVGLPPVDHAFDAGLVVVHAQTLDQRRQCHAGRDL